MSRPRPGRSKVNHYLSKDLIRHLETRVGPEPGKLAEDRTTVIELVLWGYWDRPVMEILEKAGRNRARNTGVGK